jgi:hypothetical protein
LLSKPLKTPKILNSSNSIKYLIVKKRRHLSEISEEKKSKHVLKYFRKWIKRKISKIALNFGFHHLPTLASSSSGSSVLFPPLYF